MRFVAVSVHLLSACLTTDLVMLLYLMLLFGRAGSEYRVERM